MVEDVVEVVEEVVEEEVEEVEVGTSQRNSQYASHYDLRLTGMRGQRSPATLSVSLHINTQYTEEPQAARHAGSGGGVIYQVEATAQVAAATPPPHQ